MLLFTRCLIGRLVWLALGAALLIDNFLAERHAFIADVDVIWPRDQPPHLFLAFAAERAAIDDGLSFPR